jgi:hypothetical protein
MKRRIFNFFTVLLFTVLLFGNSNCYSQNNDADSLICLEIKGKVTNVGSKSGDTYKAELIYYNTVIVKEDISVSKSFKYDLKKDAIYTVRISKPGFITKLISIYTKLPEEHDELYRLDFETELIWEHKTKKLNADALDFPITIIYYDDKANWFYFNEEYTSNIKKCIYDVKVVRNKL